MFKDKILLVLFAFLVSLFIMFVKYSWCHFEARQNDYEATFSILTGCHYIKKTKFD